LSQGARDASTVSGDVLAPIHPVNGNYFPALDGIRALAFLMVFAQHYLHMMWGWTGVDIFFVLSGFLITGILYDTCEQPHRVRNFYIRRTLRIFPLYYGVMLLLLLSYPSFRWEWNWNWLLWPSYLGNFCRGIHPHLQNSPLQLLADFQPLSTKNPGLRLYLGHFWSLCVEEQFYLIWPWIVFWIRDRRRLMYVCAASVVICPILRIVGGQMLPQFMVQQEVLGRWTPFRVDALLLGGLVALARRGRWAGKLPVTARCIFYGLAPIMSAYLLLHRHPDLTPPAWAMTWGLTVVDLFAASVIVMALENGSITFRVFNVKPLRWLGRISYGAYVFHDIFHLEILYVVQRFTSNVKYGTAAVALAFTLLLSWASFRWYETPFIQLKDRLTT
jgi:peptidoglycan/LPS O-acetylase OafA/YrhL